MNNANYMDGVPVKIAEKFKPPPAVYNLSQPLLNKINIEDDFYWNLPTFSYDFQLEKKALSKIKQWKRIRQRNKEQRKERILKREQQRKQEFEDRQKKLLNNVSYPSTDDLSSEEEEENVEQYTKIKNSGISDIKSTSPQNCLNETVNSFHNILQPTVLSINNSSTSYNSYASTAKSTFESKISNSFNYKDFEEDTSSPFDNVELKTINDLDVLAQVLHNTQIKSCDETNKSDDSKKVSPTSLLEQCELKDENIPKSNRHLPRFNNDVNQAQGAQPQLSNHHVIPESASPYSADLPHSSLSSRHLLLNASMISNGGYNEQSYYNANANKIGSINYQLNKDQLALLDDQIKSKSVPDILIELRDEIKKSELRRYRNRSFNIEDAPKPSVEGNEVENKDVFDQLESSAKELVKQISAMGFPLKRVARIVQLLGTDDKKVIEHLIPLSELADLGFEETKISEALIRNENNKNNALDDLIS